MLSVVLLVVVCVVCALRWCWVPRRQRALANQLNTNISSLPVLGHTYHFLGDSVDQMKKIQELGKDAIAMGGISKFKYFEQLVLCVADPVNAHFILKECLNKHAIMEVFELVIKHGINFSSVPIWRPRRKAIAPIFSSKYLDKFAENFTVNAKKMTDQLNQKADSNTFSLWEFSSNYSSSSVCQNIMGVMDAEGKIFMNAVEDLWETAAYLLFRPWLQYKFIVRLIPSFKYSKSIAIVTEFISKLIKQTKQDIEKRKHQKNAEVSDDNITRNNTSAFLKYQLEAPPHLQFSDEELFQECFSLIAAGADTSATGIAFTALMLAAHPHVQDKVYAEIQDVVGTSDRDLSVAELGRLHYLDAVIQETLRLYPLFPIVVRQVDRDVVLPSGLTVVAGCGVFINIWAIHRHPAYWGADADHFRPERFLHTTAKHSAAYLPFSSGPRNCVGSRYAVLSMKTALASVVRRYRLLAAGARADIPTRFNLILKHAGNYELRLQTRG